MNFDFFPNGIRKIVYNDDIDNSEDDVGDKRPEGRKNVKDVKVVIRKFRYDDCIMKVQQGEKPSMYGLLERICSNRQFEKTHQRNSREKKKP